MKRVAQPIVRKVYGNQQPNTVQNHTTNAVKKINSLLQSGTVSVTSPANRNYGRPTPAGRQTVALTSNVSITATNAQQAVAAAKESVRCFVCDEVVAPSNLGANTLVAEAVLQPSHTKLSSKIARIVGDGFMVIIGTDDIVCRRCIQMFNQMDRLETDLERVRGSIKNLLNKKYNINDDEQPLFSSPIRKELASPPPAKLQKMNMGQVAVTKHNSNHDAATPGTTIRKLNLPLSSKDPIENQLNNMFETNNGGTVVQQQPPAKQAASAPTAAAPGVANKRTPIKMYKCMQCEFRTTDLSLFTPHYEKCKPRRTAAPARVPTTSKVPEETAAEAETNHTGGYADPKQLVALHSCVTCPYKTTDKDSYDEHVKKHMKQKPFKCRICTQRFSTREEATIHAKTHQPDFFKCGICSAIFNRRDQLMSHLEVHDESKHNIQLQKSLVPTKQPTQMVEKNSTQKLLQDTIDEALSGEPMVDAKSIQFHSCNKCSLTFLNEQLFSQHMKMHATNVTQPATTNADSGVKVLSNTKLPTASSLKTVNALSPAEERRASPAQKQYRMEKAQEEGDLESIFEKMHSEPEGKPGKGVAAKSESYTAGGITFNISIPPDGVKAEMHEEGQAAGGGIDMPALEEDEHQQHQLQQHYNQEELEAQTKQEVGEILAQHQQMQEQQQLIEQQQQQQQISINMPSLDDNGDNGDSQTSANAEGIPMELEEMQNAEDGQQIKFILNEDGQLLQLDNNHIITTDADGNQILVQGGDSDQIQQLLQSVVMQNGEGLAEGQTLQMITGENGNQMILVQGEGQEPQLIDASCLNAEGTHITTEDGTQIPVSMSYGQQPGDSGSLTILNEDGTQGQIQFQIQSQDENGQTTAILADGQQILLQTSDLQHHMHDDGSMHQQMMEDEEQQQHEQEHQEQVEGEEVDEQGQQQQQQHEEQLEEGGELESQITIDEQQEGGVKQENNDELFDFEDLIQGNSITKAASAAKKK